MANTIDSELQLTEILDSALTAFRRAVLPLRSFATVYSDVALQGDDKIAVPYYPLSTSSSQTRAADGSYKSLVTNTTTNAREVTIDKNKVQGLSFTGRERSRQPMFDPVKHGELKGHKLALDVVEDVFSLVTKANFSGTTIAASTAANFDEEDVALLAQYCAEDEWPEMRSMVLNPAFHYNLVKQPALLDLSQSGSSAALREGRIADIMGFETMMSNGVKTNNGTATALTSVTNATNLFTLASHGLTDGDIIQFTATTLPTGISGSTDYYVISATTDTFQVSATEGGSAVAISDDGTSVSFTEYERIAGFVAAGSPILCAFAPVPPTDGVRQLLIDYRQVTDTDSGAVLEYKRIAYPDTDEEAQFIEAHYGYALGESAGIKRIISTT